MYRNYVTTSFCANIVQILCAMFATSLIRWYSSTYFFFLCGKCNRGLIAILDEFKNWKFPTSWDLPQRETRVPRSNRERVSIHGAEMHLTPISPPHPWGTQQYEVMKFYKARCSLANPRWKKLRPRKRRRKGKKFRVRIWRDDEETPACVRYDPHACVRRGRSWGRERGREEGKKYVYGGNATV